MNNESSCVSPDDDFLKTIKKRKNKSCVSYHCKMVSHKLSELKECCLTLHECNQIVKAQLLTSVRPVCKIMKYLLGELM